MSQRYIFVLPDLGEGLPDAEIVDWVVPVGAKVALDAPLVSMETAKAVVDVPAPCSGVLVKIYGQKGDVIETGKALAEFELDDGPQRAQGFDSGHQHGAAQATVEPRGSAAEDADAGSVVGAVAVSGQIENEPVLQSGGFKAVPAVRALAKKLGVALSAVHATGTVGQITLQDVQQAAKNQTQSAVVRPVAVAASSQAAPMPTPTPTSEIFDRPEPLRGMRRTMARAMAQAHAQIVPTTLTEDANIHRWSEGEDLTVRLIRAMVFAASKVPALNAWFDGEQLSRTVHQSVHIGLAIDTDEGLFVAKLAQAQSKSANQLRLDIAKLRQLAQARELGPAELSGYTLMLSNFGVYAGRYATPVVLSPCVAILAAGRARFAAVPVLGAIAAQRILPLSLTFDHRACTGGEAARFLAALLEDLGRSH